MRNLKLTALLWMTAFTAMERTEAAQWQFENEQIVVNAVNRTPDQMAGFYEARGFPKAMIDIARGKCFITFMIHNKSSEVIWLDQTRWRFASAQGAVTRYTRGQWFALWEEMNMPLNARSTFRWTLLPEGIDFHPGEGAGGNVTWEFPQGPFDIEMPFAVGKADSAKSLVVNLKGVQCARD